jgi:hypothetical protein
MNLYNKNIRSVYNIQKLVNHLNLFVYHKFPNVFYGFNNTRSRCGCVFYKCQDRALGVRKHKCDLAKVLASGGGMLLRLFKRYRKTQCDQ